MKDSSIEASAQISTREKWMRHYALLPANLNKLVDIPNKEWDEKHLCSYQISNWSFAMCTW